MAKIRKPPVSQILCLTIFLSRHEDTVTTPAPGIGRSPPAPVTVIDARDSDGISSLACSDVRLVRRISQLSQVLAQQVRDDHSEEVSF